MDHQPAPARPAQIVGQTGLGIGTLTIGRPEPAAHGLRIAGPRRTMAGRRCCGNGTGVCLDGHSHGRGALPGRSAGQRNAMVSGAPVRAR